MNDPVFAFIKIGQRHHLEQLRKGKLFMNTWAYFRNLEGDEVRGDPLEGTLSLFQAPRVQIAVEEGGKLFPIQDLVGQVKLSGGNTDEYNIFCMFAITENSHKQLAAEKVKDLGDYAAAVIDGDRFLDRVRQQLRKENLPFQHRLVSYVNTKLYHGPFGPFTKADTYADQNEFRIVVHGRRKSPLVLQVGDLADVIHVFPANELGNRFKFQPK